MTDYIWVDDPPIVYVPSENVAARWDIFAKSIEDWGNPGGWDVRLSASDHIGSLIKSRGSEGRRDFVTFEYRMDNHPVAMMLVFLSSEGVLEIKFLVTHPGSLNAGGIMIEYALNKVAKINREVGEDLLTSGVVVLESYNDASTAAYAALGFRNDGKTMYLDANDSELWQQQDGVWKLKKYAQLKYLDIMNS